MITFEGTPGSPKGVPCDPRPGTVVPGSTPDAPRSSGPPRGHRGLALPPFLSVHLYPEALPQGASLPRSRTFALHREGAALTALPFLCYPPIVHMEGVQMPTRKARPEEAHVHLMLDRKLWTRVKVRAAEEGTTAVEIVRDALEAWLKGGKR